MILFDSANFAIKPDGVIGMQYDNLTRRLDFSGVFPAGWTWDALVQAGGDLDIIQLAQTDDGYGVELTRDQLSKGNCNYHIQLRAMSGELVRHTNVVQVFIPASLSGDGTWPEVPSEFRQMEDRIAEIAMHPPAPGINGYWLLWDVDADEYTESSMPVGNEGPVGPQGPPGETPDMTDYRTAAEQDVIDAGKQDKLTAGANITIEGNVISASGGGGGTSDHRALSNRDAANQHPMSSITGLEAELAGKQEVVSDLNTIRTGAALGATALQSVPDTYRTAAAQDLIDDGKQDIMISSGASVGQIAKITAVDANGKPTAWEPVAMPGGGGELELISTTEVRTEDDVTQIAFDNLGDKNEILLTVYCPWTSQEVTAQTMLNGSQLDKDWYKFQSTNKTYLNFYWCKKIKSGLWAFSVGSTEDQQPTRIWSNNQYKNGYFLPMETDVNSIGFNLSSALRTQGSAAANPCIIKLYAR